MEVGDNVGYIIDSPATHIRPSIRINDDHFGQMATRVNADPYYTEGRASATNDVVLGDFIPDIVIRALIFLWR